MFLFSGIFYLYRSAHSFQCVKKFLLSFVGRAHWRAASSAAGCKGLNRAASEVRFQVNCKVHVKIEDHPIEKVYPPGVPWVNFQTRKTKQNSNNKKKSFY